MPSFRIRDAAYLASPHSVLIAATLLLGCDGGEAERAARSEAQARQREDSQQATAAAFAAVTEVEALRLAVKIDSAVAAGDASNLRDDFDVDAFIAVILQQPRYESVNASAFADRFKREGISSDDFLRNSLAGVSAQTIPDGEYHRLRIRRQEGRTTAIFRLLSNDMRLNYHEFAFVRGVDGRARIADVYIYALGEWLSETVGRTMFPSMGNQQRKRSKAEQEEEFAQVAILKQVQACMDRGDAAGVDELVAKLSPELQREKYVIVMQITAAGRDAKRLAPPSDRLAELYPDDPSTFLMCSDRYFFEGRYEEALAMIDKLDAHVGGDPYLSAYRGELLCHLNRLPEARASGLAAHEADPTLDAAYATLANVAVLEGDFDETASWIRELAELRQTRVTYARAYVERDFPAWDDFRKSDAWRKLVQE